MLCSSLASRNIGFILIYLYMCQNEVVMSELYCHFAFGRQPQFLCIRFKSVKNTNATDTKYLYNNDVTSKKFQPLCSRYNITIKSVFIILSDLFTNALIQDNRFSDIHFPHSKYYAFTCTYVTYYP